jgi:hypothetical protein
VARPRSTGPIEDGLPIRALFALVALVGLVGCSKRPDAVAQASVVLADQSPAPTPAPTDPTEANDGATVSITEAGGPAANSGGELQEAPEISDGMVLVVDGSSDFQSVQSLAFLAGGHRGLAPRAQWPRGTPSGLKSGSNSLIWVIGDDVVPFSSI